MGLSLPEIFYPARAAFGATLCLTRAACQPTGIYEAGIAALRKARAL